MRHQNFTAPCWVVRPIQREFNEKLWQFLLNNEKASSPWCVSPRPFQSIRPELWTQELPQHPRTTSQVKVLQNSTANVDYFEERSEPSGSHTRILLLGASGAVAIGPVRRTLKLLSPHMSKLSFILDFCLAAEEPILTRSSQQDHDIFHHHCGGQFQTECTNQMHQFLQEKKSSAQMSVLPVHLRTEIA